MSKPSARFALHGSCPLCKRSHRFQQLGFEHAGQRFRGAAGGAWPPAQLIPIPILANESLQQRTSSGAHVDPCSARGDGRGGNGVTSRGHATPGPTSFPPGFYERVRLLQPGRDTESAPWFNALTCIPFCGFRDLGFFADRLPLNEEIRIRRKSQGWEKQRPFCKGEK